MLIACKYEEIHPPEVNDFAFITDNSYTREQVLHQEMLLLSFIEFDLTFTTSHGFLNRFIQLANIDNDTDATNFATYLNELTLFDTKMLKWKPSLIATASVFLAKKLLKRPTPWCSNLQEHTSFREKKVRECARDICIMLNSVSKKKNFENLYKKYSTSKFGRVAQIPERLRQEASEAQSQSTQSPSLS
jgi:G2/mitotic-specific cyclin-B, other